MGLSIKGSDAWDCARKYTDMPEAEEKAEKIDIKELERIVIVGTEVWIYFGTMDHPMTGGFEMFEFEKIVKDLLGY